LKRSLRSRNRGPASRPVKWFDYKTGLQKGQNSAMRNDAPSPGRIEPTLADLAAPVSGPPDLQLVDLEADYSCELDAPHGGALDDQEEEPPEGYRAIALPSGVRAWERVPKPLYLLGEIAPATGVEVLDACGEQPPPPQSHNRGPRTEAEESADGGDSADVDSSDETGAAAWRAGGGVPPGWLNEGGEGTGLTFESCVYTVRGSRCCGLGSTGEKRIFSGVTGGVRRGETIAILGPVPS
jgi:hypothetical protein